MWNLTKKKVLKPLANLQFAISLLFVIGIIIGIGTIIEQDQSLAFYQKNYPESAPIFGFLTWKIIKFFNLDILYTSWWFTTILFLFGSSLLACTFTTQLPSLKTFKQWTFRLKPAQYKQLNINDLLDLEYSNTAIYNIHSKSYQFFRQRNKSYAYSGLLGRVGPIVVHGSLILLLLGSLVGSFGGYTAQEIIPRGEVFHIQNLTKFGNLTAIPQDLSCRINNFWITYTKERKIDQFYSDLSVLDYDGQELKRKIIFVNEPLIYRNTVFYQTDWDIIGLKVKLQNNDLYQIPLKRINKGGNRFWFGSLPLPVTPNEPDSNLTVVVNDLSGNILLYDEKGRLITSTSIGASFTYMDGSVFRFNDFITSTGLQIKSDPGIGIIYSSFLLLMVSIYVSFFNYSQLWFLEGEQKVTLGGKSNRAVLFFQEEFRKIIKQTKKQLI